MKKRAMNGFDSMSYNASVWAKSGKLLRIANNTAEKNQKGSAPLLSRMAMSNDSSQAAALKSIPSTNTVESTRMHHYLLEDIIAIPVGESVVICVEGSHPSLRRIVNLQTNQASSYLSSRRTSIHSNACYCV